MSASRTLLAIPVYNEAAHLQTVLSHARHYVSDILVIDDGSTDDTPRLLALETRLTVIQHSRNLGYGQSLADAFDHAIQAGYDWLITMDCDWQHEPSHIPEFIAAAQTDRWDIVSGSRYLADAADQSVAPADRRAINHQITALLNDRLGLHLTDAFCGFKAYRVAGLRSLRITVPGYAMPLQLWVQAWRAGLRISELPIRLIYNDPNRHFGGELDDPAARLSHYLATLNAELEAVDASGPPVSVAAWLPTTGPSSDPAVPCGESSHSVDAAPCCRPPVCD
ncbi:MAG: glycosyltransferase family 2 protein [Planctomycetes bacterium]|nr:glycosyltransferase family 2 protein [Planctomycetota bacterium]